MKKISLLIISVATMLNSICFADVVLVNETEKMFGAIINHSIEWDLSATYRRITGFWLMIIAISLIIQLLFRSKKESKVPLTIQLVLILFGIFLTCFVLLNAYKII